MKRANANRLIQFNLNETELQKDFPNYDDIVLAANSNENVYSCLIVTGESCEEVGLNKFRKKYSTYFA